MGIVVVYVFGLRPLNLVSGKIMSIAYLMQVLFGLLLYQPIVFEDELDILLDGLLLALLHRGSHFPFERPLIPPSHVEELAAAESL